jgi:hypothetical protein
MNRSASCRVSVSLPVAMLRRLFPRLFELTLLEWVLLVIGLAWTFDCGLALLIAIIYPNAGFTLT